MQNCLWEDAEWNENEWSATVPEVEAALWDGLDSWLEEWEGNAQ